MIRLFCLMAGLFGALGVAGLAMAAHLKLKADVASAAQILLFHAPVIIAVVAARGQGYFQHHLSFLALCGFLIGALLFAGDIALRAFLGKGLIPYAAPAGGFILIGSWCVLATSALLRR